MMRSRGRIFALLSGVTSCLCLCSTVAYGDENARSVLERSRDAFRSLPPVSLVLTQDQATIFRGFSPVTLKNNRGESESYYSDSHLHIRTSLCLDSARWDCRADAMASEGTNSLQPELERRYLWDGERYYEFTPQQPRQSMPWLRTSTRETWKGEFSKVVSGVEVFGWLPCDKERVTDLLCASASEFSLQSTPETIDGSPCQVVEGHSAAGYYKIWIDPGNGYLLRKAIVRKQGGDLFYGMPLSQALRYDKSPNGAGQARVSSSQGVQSGDIIACTELETVLSGVVVQSIGGCFFITQAEIAQTQRYTGGEEIVVSYKTTATDIKTNPDFETAGAFRLGDVPDGTAVEDFELSDLLLEWRSGAIVPKISQKELDQISDAADQAVSLVRPGAPADEHSQARIPAPVQTTWRDGSIPSKRWILLALGILLGGMLLLAPRLLRSFLRKPQ